MVIRNEAGEATMVTVKYKGVDIPITREMLAGTSAQIKPCEDWAEVLELARLDPEARAAIDEMMRAIFSR